MSDGRAIAKAPVPGGFVRIGVASTTFPDDLQTARRQFSEFRAVHIDGVLEPGFLTSVMRMLESATFTAGPSGPGFREVESPQRVGKMLNLVLSRPELLRWLEDVSGAGPLKRIEGRITQTLNRPGDELRWHDDSTTEEEGRRLAIVINFSTEAYEGGEFALRYKTGRMLFEHHYTKLGSGLIFEVDRELEHRVLPLTVGGPRRVFAGWAFSGEAQ
jgi:hypothetical protein